MNEQLTLELKEQSNRRKPEINTKLIQSEFQEYAGGIPLKVKLNKNIRFATRINWRDNFFEVLFNPKLIRTQKQLDYHLNSCREALGS